jgi:cyanophycin synthetase
MASLSDGEVIFFAADPAHPVVLAHRAAGGRALTLSAGRVMLGQGGHETAVAELRVLPWTRAGTCPHQVDNLLAAVAAAWALDLSPEQIREGIAGFDPGAGWSRA